MSDYTKYTKQEMQAYAIAKNIKENQIVIVGTGLPLIGASLAKRVVCPSCHPIVESGLMECKQIEVPHSSVALRSTRTETLTLPVSLVRVIMLNLPHVSPVLAVQTESLPSATPSS